MLTSDNLKSAAIRPERRLAHARLTLEKATTAEKRKKTDVSPAVTVAGGERTERAEGAWRGGSVVERFVRLSGTFPFLADRNGQSRN